MTEYHAESRRCPPRTSMCLRWTPSKAAGIPASARRARSFTASVLNSTRSSPSLSNAWRSRTYSAPAHWMENHATQPLALERVAQQDVLRAGVRSCPEGRGHDPGIADLHGLV